MSDDGLHFHRLVPAARPAPAEPAGRSWRLPALIGAGVAVLGLAIGFWARPNLDTGKTAQAAMAPSINAAVPIEVAPGATNATTPRPDGKLEVLPPDMAAAANARAQVYAPPRAPYAESAGAPAAATSPAPSPAAQPPLNYGYETQLQRPSARADCTALASLADQMVCQDPRLANQDRQMARALRRALASGAVPPEQIRAEQRDFAAIREDAARRSPRALESAYAQRIDELNSLADDSRDDEGPGL